MCVPFWQREREYAEETKKNDTRKKETTEKNCNGKQTDRRKATTKKRRTEHMNIVIPYSIIFVTVILSYADTVLHKHILKDEQKQAA